MTNQVDFDARFEENLDVLEDQIEDLVLDAINVAEIKFDSGQEFEAVKKYLKDQVRSGILHVVYRMQRKRMFDKDIEP